MKRINYLLICTFILFFANSCFPIAENSLITEIKIVNKSSIDLSIDFDLETTIKNVIVRQNKSNYFILEVSMSGMCLNPNNEVKNIIISNLETKENICELENIENNLFVFIKEEITNSIIGNKKAYYTFEITNDLLN